MRISAVGEGLLSLCQRRSLKNWETPSIMGFKLGSICSSMWKNVPVKGEQEKIIGITKDFQARFEEEDDCYEIAKI